MVYLKKKKYYFKMTVFFVCGKLAISYTLVDGR